MNQITEEDELTYKPVEHNPNKLCPCALSRERNPNQPMVICGCLGFQDIRLAPNGDKYLFSNGIKMKLTPITSSNKFY